MKHIAVLLLLAAGTLCARSAETVYFRAVMLPSNEVPPANIAATGVGTMRAHVVRNDAGQVIDGTVDFLVDYNFPGATTFTGLHIHTGVAGVNGPVSIDSGITGANNVVDATGRGSIVRQGQAPATDERGLTALRGMLENPAGYYLNLHTTQFPGGAIRGQLQRADTAVFMTLMSPLNEVPAITTLDASGVGHVRAITTRDASGALTSGQLLFDVNYRFPGETTFTGFHIHSGAAGVNGPVIFDSGITGTATVTTPPSGTGVLQFPVEVNLSRAVEAEALAGLLANPAGYYLNLHTTEFRGGAIRAQLRPTGKTQFQIDMLPSNEVPPIAGLDASAVSVFTAHTVRGEDGNILAGVADFDVNHRFAGPAEFTGLHIHNAAAGVNGPVTIDSGIVGANPVVTQTGFGNIFRTVNVSSATGIATLNSMVRHPENHYLNLHTRVNPGGAVRAQLAPENTAPPAIGAVIAANLDANATTIVPGGLITIFGTNLAKVTADLSGWQGNAIPPMLNGVAVAVGGQFARLLYVSPTQVNAQVAFDTPTGNRLLLAVNNGNAPSAPVAVTVARTAPAIFFGPSGALALKNEDFSLVGPGNPARAGDVILLYSTGLGQTTPPLQTGAIVGATPIANTQLAGVTIGGQNAEVLYSIASPGFVGLYQTAVRVPAGVAPGNAPVVLTSGSAASGSVNLAVQ